MITIQDVKKVAMLARLEFDDEAEKKLLIDLENILKYIEKLNQVNTNNVEPFLMKNLNQNALRYDILKNDFTREEIMKNAPQKDDKFFIVKKVIE